MPIPTDYSFIRYLSAKKSVDDRALNRYVWQKLQDGLKLHSSAVPLRVLEIGAGIGTMVERIAEWGLTEQSMQYTAIDAIEENISEAQHRLAPLDLDVRLEAINLFDLLEREPAHSYDLIIAHAFLDLIDLPMWLPKILTLIVRGGLFYFTVNFDGLTILEPGINTAFDDLVMRLYHETMDQRITDGLPSGDSRAGRHLFETLRRAGGQVIAAGSSDWVVHPLSGAYPADEAYFLHFIVHTIDGALRGNPALDAPRFAAWIAERHAQIERGELVYIAHQMDFVGAM
jgi:predicted O-methyltransferase YrrM